jgi:cation diffusion facilitator CzcD-associated flavoprotein CzcO
MQGSKQFKGLQLHAKQFTDPAVCAGKKVLIVGSGKTALDASSEVAMSHTAASITWLFRQV